MYLMLLASYLVNLLMFYFLYIFFYDLYDQYNTKESITQTQNKIKTDSYNLYLFFKIFFIIGIVSLVLILSLMVLNGKITKRN